MTTTAHEDQFTVAPEPVRQQYSTADILRRNVADLEIALRKQTERAEKAEAELAKLREQKPGLYMAFSECGQFIRYWTRDTKNLEATMAVNDFEVLEFYAAPVTAPAVPDANPVQWLADEGDMILVPRGLLGAACSSIDKQRPAPKVLEALRYYTMNAPQAPAVPAPAVPDGDDFNGSTPHLIQCMEALVRLDADGVLVPHGIGRDASKLLSAAANRLRQQAASSIPEEWRKVMARLLDTFERCEAGFHPHVEIRLAVRDEARALLQSAEVTK